MSSTKFSVIVPVYNTEKYLESCVKSVLSQSNPDFELILVDDGSTDGSGLSCDRFADLDGRVRVIHQPNFGHITARMNGVKAAVGEWILFLDSDDEWKPNLLETVDISAKKYGCDMLIFRLQRENEICHDFFCGEKDEISAADYYETNLAESGLNSLVIKACRRELFEKTDVKGFRKFKNSEDLLLSIQLVRNAKKISYITDVLYFYRLHEGSITSCYNENALEEFAFSREMLWNELKKFGRDTPANRMVLCTGFLRRAADCVLQISMGDSKTSQKFSFYREIAQIKLFAESIKTADLNSLSRVKRLRLRLLAGGNYNTLLLFDKLRSIKKQEKN